MAWMLLILNLSQPWSRCDPVNVDRVEINTVWDCGSPRFEQIILWRWSSQLHRFHVAEWQMLPTGYVRERGNVVRWIDANGGTRRVRTKAFIVTRGIDTEVQERKHHPTSERVPYFD